MNLTLSGVPAGYTVTNGTYPAWCVEAFNFDFTLHQQYCGATLYLSTDPGLPSYLQNQWGIVNYILNHKQGNDDDVQNAIWYFTDGWIPSPSEQTAAYFAIINDAASHASFVPGVGEIVAVILDMGETGGPQRLVIEVTITGSNGGPGTGTPGYWKNHPEAWPVSTITLGGVNYTLTQAIAIMQQATSKDKTYNLAEQLIAAKLNVMVGNEASCITTTIANADAFLAAYPIASGVKASSSAWQSLGSELLTTLTAYNEGLLCAPSRD